MAKIKMSIQRGLDQINLLEKRIINAMPSSQKPVISSQIGDKPVIGTKDDKDFAIQAMGTLDSVEALLDRRDEIKAAIITANATTFIPVGKEKMSIATAIERRTSIKYRKQLLHALKLQYTTEVALYEQRYDTYGQKLQQQLESLYGKEYKGTNADEALKPFNEIHKPRLVDPLELKTVINKLEEEIDTFESEIKFALTEANVVTQIEVTK